MSQEPTRPRVCIVGGGITGLSCAWLLSRRGKFDVTVVERWGSPGLDAHKAVVPLPETGDSSCPSSVTVDIPFRVFNRKYYQNMVMMFGEIGVDWLPVNYSGSYCRGERDTGAGISVFFKYSNIILGGLSLPFVSGQGIFTRDFAVIVRDYVWFCTFATRDLLSGALEGLTLGEYLDRKGYSRAFAHDVLLTALAVMCTCTYETMRSFPADLVIRCMAARANYGIQRAVGGNEAIALRLSQYCDVRCDAEVMSVSGGPPASVTYSDGETETFDHVILATQANQALRLLGEDATAEERSALGLFDYEASDVVVHSDATCMPPARSDWEGVSFFTGGDGSRSSSRDMPMATIWLNRVNTDLTNLPVNIFQTWNPHFEPSEGTTVCRAAFERPVINARAVQGMGELRKVQGQRGLWYCGSYARYAMPLLENGVTSAAEIAVQLGIDVPWDLAGDPVVQPWFARPFFVRAGTVIGIAALAYSRADFLSAETRSAASKVLAGLRNVLQR